jgi:hypothetical protein
MGAMTSTPPSVLTPERQGERIVGGRLCVLERGEDAERMQRGCREDAERCQRRLACGPFSHYY